MSTWEQRAAQMAVFVWEQVAVSDQSWYTRGWRDTAICFMIIIQNQLLRVAKGHIETNRYASSDKKRKEFSTRCCWAVTLMYDGGWENSTISLMALTHLVLSHAVVVGLSHVTFVSRNIEALCDFVWMVQPGLLPPLYYRDAKRITLVKIWFLMF